MKKVYSLTILIKFVYTNIFKVNFERTNNFFKIVLWCEIRLQPYFNIYRISTLQLTSY